MQNIKLIGITGRAKQGKDTAANHIERKYGFSTKSFADPLKEAASIIFNIEPHYFHNQDLKEQVIPFWGISPREILQKLGTEGVRDIFGDTVWLDNMSSRLDGNTVIPDIRFENEAEFVRVNDGLVIHITRNEAEVVRNHVSENELSVHSNDIIIYNNGSLEELYHNIDEVVVRFYDL